MSRVEKTLIATLIITIAWFSLSFLRGWECESIRNVRARIMTIYRITQDVVNPNMAR